MKRFGFLAMSMAVVVGALIGGVVTGVGTLTAGPASAPAPAPTVTATATVTVEAPEPEPTTAPAVYRPKTSDWRVKVKVRDKQCFGSAGCSVTVKLDPEYVGTRALPDTGTIEVFYSLSGDESGPIDGSFTASGGQIHYDEEADLSTPKNDTQVKAKITDATYSEN